LTRIQEVENIATLMYLLPSKIASPLSINSLTANIKCSFATVSNYLKAMELGYLIFRISPYSKKIARSLTKERGRNNFHNYASQLQAAFVRSQIPKILK